MYKLAVFDVDGTLVSRQERVLLDSTITALKTLQAKGIKIAIASGRPAFAMEKSLLEKITFDYFICSNGTYVMDQEGKELYKEVMPVSLVEALTLDFVHNDDAILYQFEDNAYIYHGKKRMCNMMNQCLGRLDILKDDREHTARHLTSLPYAAVAYIDKNNLAFYQMRYPAYRFECFMDNYYDIYPFLCTKASGIIHLCEVLHLTMKDVICFGDALNDVEMIKQCGLGVAMGDALVEVKQVADYVTSTSSEEGIYRACLHFHLL
ncbi:MAG: Cof-type HAD-IIB family hydrolase [Erysipelotrichia bacterium]|nr:Cof-type HAD-IIB family hydrolase [Erysipelotrichia bacterium]NCC54215.1 Cof-type HAD-IIB family hydrolase [Erysipelotrichia bacterium]